MEFIYFFKLFIIIFYFLFALLSGILDQPYIIDEVKAIYA